MIGDRPISGCSSMVEQQPSKLNTRVRFPSPAPAFHGFSERSHFILTNGPLCTFRCSPSDRLFCVSLETLSYSPHHSRPLEVRAHQNRISWFGKEIPNARAEIGDDGVKIGQLERKACEETISRESIGGLESKPIRFGARRVRCARCKLHRSDFALRQFLILQSPVSQSRRFLYPHQYRYSQKICPPQPTPKDQAYS